MEPVIRAGICIGEEVAGFKDVQTGKIEEIMLIRSTEDWPGFLQDAFGVLQLLEFRLESSFLRWQDSHSCHLVRV